MRSTLIRVFGFALLATLGMVGCATAAAPFVVALPNGYEIMRKQDRQPAVVKRSNGSVVIGPITIYAVVRDVVTGVVPSPPADGGSAKRSSKVQPGYFILKTDTGEITQGLSEQDWKDRLKALGVTMLPTLNPPILPG
jgi:hypothetical protein